MDLRKIEVETISGEKQELELDYKGFANYIYNNTRDLGELELARELYNNGVVELTKESATTLKLYVTQCFVAVIQKAIIAKLDEVINS